MEDVRSLENKLARIQSRKRAGLINIVSLREFHDSISSLIRRCAELSYPRILVAGASMAGAPSETSYVPNKGNITVNRLRGYVGPYTSVIFADGGHHWRARIIVFEASYSRCYHGVTFGDCMATTSLKLPDDVKELAAVAAKHRGMTPHAFMVDAIRQVARAAEKRARLVAEAQESRGEALASGKGFAANDVHAYIRARAQRKAPARPRAKSWRR